jgi:hypothetical protein
MHRCARWLPQRRFFSSATTLEHLANASALLLEGTDSQLVRQTSVPAHCAINNKPPEEVSASHLQQLGADLRAASVSCEAAASQPLAWRTPEAAARRHDVALALQACSQLISVYVLPLSHSGRPAATCSAQGALAQQAAASAQSLLPLAAAAFSNAPARSVPGISVLDAISILDSAANLCEHSPFQHRLPNSLQCHAVETWNSRVARPVHGLIEMHQISEVVSVITKSVLVPWLTPSVPCNVQSSGPPAECDTSLLRSAMSAAAALPTGPSIQQCRMFTITHGVTLPALNPCGMQ